MGKGGGGERFRIPQYADGGKVVLHPWSVKKVTENQARVCVGGFEKYNASVDNLCGVLPVLLSLNNFTDILFDFVSLSPSLLFFLFAFSLFLFFRDLMSPRSKYGVRIDE